MTNGIDEQKDELIAKAERAERKRKKKEDKARRKAEKREKKRILEAQNGNSDDSDIEIIEDDNGVCTVSIQPRPIKLTIKTNGHQNPSTSNALNNSGKYFHRQISRNFRRGGGGLVPGVNIRLYSL